MKPETIAFAVAAREYCNDWMVFIPDKRFGILPGWHSRNQIVGHLRALRECPEAIQFIADMLEV